MAIDPDQRPAGGDWTVADYMALDDDERRELIEGEMRMTPAPDGFHQRASLELGRRLAAYIREHDLGECFFAPFDVVLGEDTVVQPDFLFVDADRFSELYDGHGVTGAPDLVVEVLSPGRERRDRVEKRKLYARAGVAWLLLVEPRERLVEIFRLEEDRYVLDAAAGGDETLAIGAFDAFEIELADVWFEEPD